MRSSNFVVAIIVLLLINLSIIGVTLAGIGSQHDTSSVDSSITSLESLNFEWAWGLVVEMIGLNIILISLKNYFVFGSCGVDWYLSVGDLQTQTLRMSVQYDPCVARQKITTEPNYYLDDDQSKQAMEFEGDIEGFEESDFCKKSAKACASAGAVSGALYGTAFAFAFINLVLHVMRFMEDNMTKCYIAAGLELLTLIFMAVGTASFNSGCIVLAMKDLDDYYNSLVAALTAGGGHTDDYFTDDVEKNAELDLSAKWNHYNGTVAACGITAASISFVLIACVACSRPTEDVPPVQNITINNINGPAAPNALASKDAQNEPEMEMHQFYGVNPLAGQQMPPQQYPQGYPGQAAPYPVNYPASMSPGMPKERKSSSKKSKKSSSE